MTTIVRCTVCYVEIKRNESAKDILRSITRYELCSACKKRGE